jgi:S-(hydroxymethyl)glutathione dehydrogenase/alcohol dehydrogenase
VHQLCAVASFAERAVIPSGAAIRIDPDVPLDTACVIGCGVTTGLGAALNTATIREGQSVAVIGCGGVGLSIVQGARIAGAATIIAIEPVAAKRELAISMGATHAVDPGSEDVVKTVRGITRMGVHWAFEALGRTETIQQAWSLLRPAGMAVVVGMPSLKEELHLRMSGFFTERGVIGSVYGSSSPRRDIPKFVELYRKGELELERMITNRIPLEDVNLALDALHRGEGARTVIQVAHA